MKKLIIFMVMLCLFTGCGKVENKESDNELDKFKTEYNKLSNSEKKAINYNELIEDFNSIEKNNTTKYAKAKAMDSNNNTTSRTWIGEGYYIKKLDGGEVIQYVFYTNNDKEIYTYNHYYPLTN